ncbi:MAG: hypothetical protein IJ480_00310 [Clostridia bacterium]|nr:hypothetical protein [Clostridia bacterium]
MEIVKITNIRDNQIFQQENGFADIPVKGRFTPEPGDTGTDPAGYPGKSVWVLLNREEDSTFVILPVRIPLAEDGTFSGVLPHVPAGGPYTLLCQLGGDHVHGDWERRGECRFHLGVGDLFLIAGQSNAAGYGKTPGYDPTDPDVHLFRNAMTWHTAAHPLNDSTDSCHPVNAEWATPGSSPFLRFAAVLRRVLGYPIGLIQVSKGDTCMTSWCPPEFPDPIAEKRGLGALRGSLWQLSLDMAAAAGGKIAGVLWYQGCNDADADEWTEIYADRFDCYVTGLRKALGAPDLPFYTVQLNKSLSEDPGDAAVLRRWAVIKEFQRNAPRRLPHVYVTVSHDQPMSDRIHNNTVANTVIGERLAWLALETEYGRAYFGKAPDLREAVLDRKTGVLRLFFDNVYAYLADLQHPFPDITVTAADRTLPILKCGVSGSSICVYLDPAQTAELTGSVLVSFGVSPFGHAALPIDRITGMPPLGFYNAEAVLL